MLNVGKMENGIVLDHLAKLVALLLCQLLGVVQEFVMVVFG